MAKQRTAAQIQAILKAVNRDRAKGLVAADSCRRHGISEKSYYRWLSRTAATTDDATKQVRNLSTEVERLKQLLAETMRDNRMMREVAKKSGDRFAATSGGGVFEGEILGIAAAGGAAAGAESLDGALPGQGAGRRGRAREGDPPAGASPSALRVAADSRLADGDGLESEPQAGASADGGTGVSAADSPENQGETSVSRIEQERLHESPGDGAQRCLDVRFHPRSDDLRRFAQVVVGGRRIHSGVVGARAGVVDDGGGRAACVRPPGGMAGSAAGGALR